MTDSSNLWRRRAVGFLLMLLSGCVSPSPTVSFYVLTPGGEEPVAAAGAPSLGVVPVELPSYLNRSQIVVRRGSEVEVAEYHRWAGNLQREVSRVLVVDLARALGSQQVALYPLAAEFVPDYRLTVDLDRFDGSPEQGVTLNGRWALIRPATRQVELASRFEIVEPVAGEGMTALAEAHSRALDRLARSIAAEIAARPREQ